MTNQPDQDQHVRDFEARGEYIKANNICTHDVPLSEPCERCYQMIYGPVDRIREEKGWPPHKGHRPLDPGERPSFRTLLRPKVAQS